MLQQRTQVSTAPVADADRQLEEMIEEITRHTLAYHKRHPTAPLRYCVQIGMGTAIRRDPAPGSPLVNLAMLAVDEMAGRWLLAQEETAQTPTN